MYQIKALLVDLDGTLILSQDPICNALHQCFLHVGAVAPSKQAIIDMFGLPVEVMLTTLTEVEETETERINEFIAEYKRQYPIHMTEAKLISGALETMQALFEAGVKICLITSERRQNAEHILKALGLSKFIKFLISRDDVVQFKPHPEPLFKGLEMVGEAAASCIYIGESPFDIQAGIASGIFTIGVPSGDWTEESLVECHPNFMLPSIDQLLEVLQNSIIKF